MGLRRTACMAAPYSTTVNIYNHNNITDLVASMKAVRIPQTP